MLTAIQAVAIPQMLALSELFHILYTEKGSGESWGRGQIISIGQFYRPLIEANTHMKPKQKSGLDQIQNTDKNSITNLER
jgi:hypothetical protein